MPISMVFVYEQLNFTTVLFQAIQFSIITQFQCQKQFYFKQFNLVKVKFNSIKKGSISNNSVEHTYSLVLFDP